jgi:hypothetical protein
VQHALVHAAPFETVPLVKTPFIEYHNRMAVFSIDHLVYERIKPHAFYTGVEGWILRAFDGRFIAEAEYRAGYNFFWNGRDHFTPLAGVGFFQELYKSHHCFHKKNSGIVYGTLGFLYDHEFTDVFNLGLNVKGIIGGPVTKKPHHWGSPVAGIDVSLPITFRFGYKRHWDTRIEPFDIYLHGSHHRLNTVGFRSTVGYRF